MVATRVRALAGAALLCLTSVAHAGLLDGLGGTLGHLGGALGGSLNQIGNAFGDSLERFENAFGDSLAKLNGNYLDPVPGTTSFEEVIVHQGIGRTSLIIRPQADAPGLAPVVILLHYGRGTPKAMANLSHIGRLAAEHGAWVILPTAENRSWNEDPASYKTIDDVGYLAKVIQSAIAQHPIDPKRVYMAGMSNGGFMTNRFVCEHAEMVTAAAQVVASMRKTEDALCKPSRAVPITFILGTNDVLVRYNAEFGLLSADKLFARWQKTNDCDPSGVLTETLPNVASDGTTTTLKHNEVCTSGAGVQLYTVNGGGHTWPEGDDANTKIRIGRTSHDFSATDAIWDFVSEYQR